MRKGFNISLIAILIAIFVSCTTQKSFALHEPAIYFTEDGGVTNTFQMQAEYLMEESAKKNLMEESAKKKGCDGEDECKPYCKYERVESCTFCSLFALVFNTVSAIGEKQLQLFLILLFVLLLLPLVFGLLYRRCCLFLP